MNKNLIGNKWSRHSYGEITDINGSDVQIKNEDGKTWWISDSIFKDEFKLSSVFQKVVPVTQTVLAETMTLNPGVIMTVNFNKKVDIKDVISKLVDIHTVKVFSEADAKRAAKEILEGEERTIIGRHYNNVDDMGRIQFIDMELDKIIKTAKDDTTYDTRLRKVDPRTINWIIVDNIKYVLK